MAEIINLLAAISQARTNPASIHRVALGVLEEVLDGSRTVVDPSNPFVYLLEMSAVNTAAAMIESAANTRKQYGVMALTEAELYLHMSYKDYLNRFSTPSRTGFSIILDKDEIYARAVPTGVGSIRKLTIPRNTEITISGYKFTMQYPIEIRIMGHGGLQIVYNVDKPSPLQTLETNVVDWSIVYYNKVPYVRLNIPMQQFQITTTYAPLNAAQVFNKTYDLVGGDFCYCRAYMSNLDGSWTEILTTHTDQVFDPLKPTVLLTVFKNTVNVRLPQVYFTTGLVTKELRIDVYTTAGPLDMILDSYAPNAFTARWVDLEGDDNGIYSAPLSQFTSMAVFSDQVVAGGSPAITFEALRQRVINNSMGSTNLPITNVQVGNALSDLGYQSVTDVDVVTNRVMLATRSLPIPTNKSVSAGAACSMSTFQTTLDQLQGRSTVKDNGNRMTLLPSCLYENQGGKIVLVDDITLLSLKTQPHDLLAYNVTNSNYVFSQFHYVLDINDNAFECRGYYLDKPVIATKLFVEENDTTGIEVSADQYAIERVENGFKLTIITKSGDTFKAIPSAQVYAQLHFSPLGEADRACLNGTLVATTAAGELVYEFLLGTNYDITAENGLILNTFIMYNNEVRNYATSLLGDFDLVIGVSGYTTPGMTESAIDTVVGAALLPDDFVGVIQERLRIQFGYALDGLWSNARSVISSQQYLTYDTNVLAFYDANVYARDPVTGTINLTVDGGGNLNYQILHHKGDPVLDPVTGLQLYKHFKGDLILDTNGDPIGAAPRGMYRQVDLMMIDGNYYFATEAASVAYRQSIPDTVVGWLNTDIAQITLKLLEQTKLYFYPQCTQGDVKVTVKEGQTTTINATQAFTVTFYLTAAGYMNPELRPALTKMAIDTIAAAMGNPVVTRDGIVTKLSAMAGDDVLSVNLNGFGGTQNLDIVSLVDDSARLSIAKKLVSLPDNTLTVQDDVTILFVNHQA